MVIGQAQKQALRGVLAALFISAGAVQPLPAQPQAQGVELSFATALVRDILTAVNHGNWTGNYTVLRDYAASDFAAANDPTRLAGLFTPVRERGLDLLPVLVTDPVLLSAQTARGDSQMRLTGYFPLRPEHVSFDMVFIREGRGWLLLDISVGAFDPIDAPVQPSAPSAAAPGAAPIPGGDTAPGSASARE